ncbi:MAG: hypothetical protein ACRCWQ_01250, partial [Bacilli bacterium]
LMNEDQLLYLKRKIRSSDWERVHSWKDAFFSRHMVERIQKVDVRNSSRNTVLQSIVELEKDIAVLQWPEKENYEKIVKEFYQSIGYSPNLRWWTEEKVNPQKFDWVRDNFVSYIEPYSKIKLAEENILPEDKEEEADKAKFVNFVLVIFGLLFVLIATLVLYKWLHGKKKE